jgi:tetratricopeptide (TPR) repeat protein
MAVQVKKSKANKPATRNPADFRHYSTQLSLLVWLLPLSIVLLTFLAFLPVLQNGFINWDDVGNLIQNTHYRGFDWDKMRWMFSNVSLGLYRPVTWMTLAFDYLLWEMNPTGYHLTSLLFHCANALLFYFVALRLLRLSLSALAASEATLRLAAGFAALFFSLHPLRVEAIAWASARADVVAAFFLLAALLAYLRATANGAAASQYKRWIICSLLMYATSLLAKSSGMSFPFILIALDAYPLRRLRGKPQQWFSAEMRRVWWEKVPFILLSVAAGAAALIAKRGATDLYSIGQYGLWARLAESFYGLSFYLWKTIVPLWLSPLYQRVDRLDASYSVFWIYLSAVCIGVIITVALIVLRRSWPAGLTIWITYALLLAPVLGIVQFGFQAVADRYTYIACLGWALLAGAVSIYPWHSIPGKPFSPVLLASVRACAIVLLFFLGVLSWRQTQIWHDAERLWRHVLSVEPNSSYAYTNLAESILTSPTSDNGKVDEAIGYYKKAATLRPNWTVPLLNLGAISDGQGRRDEAERYYRTVMTIDPKSVTGYLRLAPLLARQNRFDEALALYSKAVELDPKNGAVHNEFANTLVKTGQLEKAIERYHKAAAVDPTFAEPYFNLGNLMAARGLLDEAIRYYREALKIDPDYAEAHHNLGRVLAAENKLDDAVDQFRAAIRLQPDFMAARESLVLALQQQGKNQEADREYAAAMQMLQSRDAGSKP